jgi:superfamily II DNA or RNA helicase
MAKSKNNSPKSHAFRNKLVLNQWLISLFGIDPFRDNELYGVKVRPFHILADSIKDQRLEGLDSDNLHHFYHHLGNCPLLSYGQPRADIPGFTISREQLLAYEENIVRHTRAINLKRQRPIIWKYYQWLTLIFIEIYLDKYFTSQNSLLDELNAFLACFNRYWKDFTDIPPYAMDDLNKLCFQNATGSGKTLLMHVNILQYRHYAALHGKDNDLSRIILLTPNERLSEQHMAELNESAIDSYNFAKEGHNLFTQAQGLAHVDVLEITKLADQEGPNTIATRSLGDQNLLLVDEGHRGMSGKDEGVWFTRRSNLCAKGFTFEYSATFEQAVKASGNADFEDSYAKTVIFDYSYRWFYEDGFGKDYQILNLPQSYEETQTMYLTACLLKFYQQLRIYEEESHEFAHFNLEKPLWVFVGSTVSSAKGTSDEKIVATDVALIIEFIAKFLDKRDEVQRRVSDILSSKGQDTGLLDKNGVDIFAGSFGYLASKITAGESVESLYLDILGRLFNNPAGGSLSLDRVKGESGEVVLRVGNSEVPFGLINVGDAKGLCDHIGDYAKRNEIPILIEESDFTEAMFASVKDSTSMVNLLIGSKKFIEGWDCWRVSTMGLMHVGRSEGSQIIQLFGRGVRLKGYDWSLKRSGHANTRVRPAYIEELETLNVFGVEADFMEKFRDFLKEEGLPGNERRTIVCIPLNVTYDFGKKLKIIRPKRKEADGKEYDFKRDGPVPTVGEIPDYLNQNPVISDWYPRIQTIQSRGNQIVTDKDKVAFRGQHISLLDLDALFFELEQYKRDRCWYNLNITKTGIATVLGTSTWYTLFLPTTRLTPSNYDGVLLLHKIASELLKRYCDHMYNYSKREYIEPRLELRELSAGEENLPQEEFYQLIVDGDEEQLILGIHKIKNEIEENKEDLIRVADISVCKFGKHLFQPLFHVRCGGKITILPVALNESEYQFVTDLKDWCDKKNEKLLQDGIELFLLRNVSSNKGIGFFEAGNFHPDFILWMLYEGKQYISFIEPHGLLHEGPNSEKVQFFKRVKEVEKRLGDADVILNSFILSWTKYPQLKWVETQKQLEDNHVLFMTDDRDNYINKLISQIKPETQVAL